MIRMVNVKSATNVEDLAKTRMVMYELEGYPGSRYFMNQESFRVRMIEEALVLDMELDEERIKSYKEAVLDEHREESRYDGCDGNCSCGGEQ